MGLTTAVGGDASKLPKHHAALRRRAERVWGFKGMEHFQVRTSEGNGVLHIFWAWKAAPGFREKRFYVPKWWLSAEWEKLHGAPIVHIDKLTLSQGSVRDVSEYVVCQYVVNQKKDNELALEGMSYSWRKTFGFPVVKVWKLFRETYAGVLRQGLIEKWGCFLCGETVMLIRGPCSMELLREKGVLSWGG